MTKDEIKKGLKCCSNPSISYCKDCPYANYGEFDCCNGKMCKDALNLITEQEKEIERLKEAIEKLTEMLNKTNEPKTNAIKIDEAVVERYENQIKQAQIELMRLSLPKSRHLWRKKGNKNNL